MLTIQHIMVSLLCHDGDIEYIKENAAMIVLPDALRAYTKYRQYTHFTLSIYDNVGPGEFFFNENGSIVACFEFPENIKSITQETINKNLQYATLPYKTAKCAIDELSNINKFYKTNSHISERIFNGVEEHLKEDIAFDVFFRKQVDTSLRFNDLFFIKRNNEIKEMNGVDIRKYATNIEMHGIYILAYLLYKKYNITINQEWLDKNIKDVLYHDYPIDLAEKTFSFMKIDEEYNSLISNHDWSKLNNGVIPYDDFITLYDCIYNMINFDLFEKYKNDGYVYLDEFVKPILELNTGVDYNFL